MKAEVPWIDRHFIGIPFKTPDYRRIHFSDGTCFCLDREKAAIICCDSDMKVLEVFPIESEDIDHFYDLTGSIALPSGRLSCKLTWIGTYSFKHEKLGRLSTEWIQFAQKGRKDLFEIFATSSTSADGVIDMNLQKAMLALELSLRHKWA